MYKNTIRRLTAIICKPIPYSWLQKLAGRKLVVVNYHSLRNSDADAIINQNPYRTAEEFEQDLIFYKKHHHIVDLQTILSHYKQHKPLPPNSLAITFDDGLAVVYHKIRPILLKHGISAAFFINPPFIDQAELHYKRKVNLISKKLRNEPQYLPAAQSVLHAASITSDDVAGAIEKLAYHQSRLINRLAEAVQVDIAQYLKENPIYLTTEQINRMIAEGFTFGAHSWDHPNYIDLLIEEQCIQTSASMQWVAEHFTPGYRFFAFPYRDFHLSKALFANIGPVDLTFGTHGMVNDVIPNHIQRTDVERSGLPCGSAMKINYLKYILLLLVGQKQLKRI